jgi:hypothetical protein
MAIVSAALHLRNATVHSLIFADGCLAVSCLIFIVRLRE